MDNSNNLNEILSAFCFDGLPVDAKPLGSGHINRTLLITTDSGKRYVLQRMSSAAFDDVPALMENVIAVTRFIAEHSDDARSTLHFIPVKSGEYYYVDETGSYWRCYEYVENSICLNLAESTEDFYQAAVAFGNFQRMLSEFPAETLNDTIPNFHNTPDRYRKFHISLDADVKNRRHTCEEETAFVLQREEMAGQLQKMLNNGELPLRVTHNDTKLNNVLFDAETRKALCVIDLDTVMPGLVAFDFGDAIRFGASTALEDETDLSKVSMSIDLFTAFTKGYLSSCEGLTEKESTVLS
jgi:Putative homoserine kinase type II (protein kinase fold)